MQNVCEQRRASIWFRQTLFFLAFFTQRVDETKSMPGRGVRGAAPVRLCAMTRRFKKLYGQSAAQTPRLC